MMGCVYLRVKTKDYMAALVRAYRSKQEGKVSQIDPPIVELSSFVESIADRPTRMAARGILSAIKGPENPRSSRVLPQKDPVNKDCRVPVSAACAIGRDQVTNAVALIERGARVDAVLQWGTDGRVTGFNPAHKGVAMTRTMIDAAQRQGVALSFLAETGSGTPRSRENPSDVRQRHP